MKNWIWMLLLLVMGGQLLAQKPLDRASATMRLAVKGSEGTNVHRLYYTVIAGNADFPLEALSDRGVILQSGAAGFDARGLWYNPYTRRLEGNSFGGELYAIELDSRGYPRPTAKVVMENVYKPGGQAVGAYDGKKSVYYYMGGVIFEVNSKTHTLRKQIKLDISESRAYNTTSMVYTGVKKYEFGLLDYSARQLHLFNRKGQLEAKVELPSDVPVNSAFRLSYANGQLWLYDAEERAWRGMKIFKR
jgi:hypothetical protein